MSALGQYQAHLGAVIDETPEGTPDAEMRTIVIDATRTFLANPDVDAAQLVFELTDFGSRLIDENGRLKAAVALMKIAFGGGGGA